MASRFTSNDRVRVRRLEVREKQWVWLKSLDADYRSDWMLHLCSPASKSDTHSHPPLLSNICSVFFAGQHTTSCWDTSRGVESLNMDVIYFSGCWTGCLAEAAI